MWRRFYTQMSAPKRLSALALVCLLSVLVAAAASARHSLPPAAPLPPAARPQGVGAIEAEQVTLTPAGLEPSEITRPQGLFVLFVDDRAAVEGIELSLEREGGGRLNALRSRRRQLSWAEEVDLPPGATCCPQGAGPSGGAPSRSHPADAGRSVGG